MTAVARRSGVQPAKRLRCSLAFAATLACCVLPAHAQQRANNVNGAGLLRIWPRVGVWQTVLSRSAETHDLASGIFTGYNNPNHGERYAWGFIQGARGAGLLIADDNPTELAGPSIAVTIDGSRIGTYPITKRQTAGAMSIVVARLSRPDGEGMTKRLRLGGKIEFTTINATYPASLWGMGAEMMSLPACVTEMIQLDAVSASGQQP